MVTRRLPFLLFFFLHLTAVASYAQSAAGPFVPPDHWSTTAIDRLHAAGVTPPGTVRGQRSRSVREVRAMLEAAAAHGSKQGATYLERFTREFAGDGAWLTHTDVEAGGGVLENDVAHGIYSTFGEENWTGVRVRPDRATALGRAALLTAWGESFAAGASVSRDPVRTRIDELYVSGRAGVLGAWAGRRLHGYGVGTSGIVLNRAPAVDGAGLFLTQPVRLPWVLRHLGPFRAEVAVGILDPNGPVRTPVFVLTRASIEPHPIFGLGVTRGGMIGPDAGARGIDDVLFFLIGGQTGGSEYDNQVVAVDAWLRPAPGRMPLVLYMEWGAEDTSGSWWNVPGILAGIELSEVPGLGWLGVAIERTSFARSGSGNPPWYRHPIGFHEGWTSRNELIGHPLGGHGREWLGQIRATLHDARVIVTARGFTRVRESENLFAPERAGRSRGASADIDVEPRRGFGLRASAATEYGTGWRTGRLSGTLRLYLPQSR